MSDYEVLQVRFNDLLNDYFKERRHKWAYLICCWTLIVVSAGGAYYAHLVSVEWKQACQSWYEANEKTKEHWRGTLRELNDEKIKSDAWMRVAANKTYWYTAAVRKIKELEPITKIKAVDVEREIENAYPITLPQNPIDAYGRPMFIPTRPDAKKED